MVGFLGAGKTQSFNGRSWAASCSTALAPGLQAPQGRWPSWASGRARVGSTTFVDVNPPEVDGGMRVALPHMFSIAVGGGRGHQPRHRRAQATGPSWRWAGRPTSATRDGDGVRTPRTSARTSPRTATASRTATAAPTWTTTATACPTPATSARNDAEDLDQFQDEDGCPEPDNDADGIPDLNDPCPNAAEDGKGKRPKDGCPSPPRTATATASPTPRDKCPDEPEDRDGFEDDDGCPDVDNDDDGIPDNFDTCPNERRGHRRLRGRRRLPRSGQRQGRHPRRARTSCPTQPETLNGNKDDDGCPDPGAEIVAAGGRQASRCASGSSSLARRQAAADRRRAPW